jgi:hypothetical protein
MAIRPSITTWPEESVLERANGPTGRRRPWHDPRASAYEILGVEEGASPATVRRAYLNLVRLWHPDRFRQDSALQQEAQLATKCINEAYWLLRPAKRAHAGRFHRTRPSDRSSGPASDRDRSVRAVLDSNNRDVRRILTTSLTMFVLAVWLAGLGLLVWALLMWD